MTATTTVATTTTTAFVGSSARLKDLTVEEEILEHVCSASFWVLGILLLIYSIALYNLLKYQNPRDPKTKPSTKPKPRTSSLIQLDFDLKSLNPCIAMPSRQIFAVAICRIAASLYCLESYWIINATWKMFTSTLEIRREGAPGSFLLLIVIIPSYPMMWCCLGYAIYIVLDLSFTFASELALLPVSTDASHTPTRKGKKRPKNDAFRGKK